MTLNSFLLAAFLKCPTKCWLRATGETPSGNPYAEWVKNQNESFRVAETERLRAQAQAPPAYFHMTAAPDFAMLPPCRCIVENCSGSWPWSSDWLARL